MNVTHPVSQSPVIDDFNYTVKIYKPASAGTEVAKFIIHKMHDFHGKFADLGHLKATVCSTFKADVPMPLVYWVLQSEAEVVVMR